MSEIKVSIVMAAYNAAQYLVKSLPAALAQDYSNYEVILVDDGSSDNTEEIVSSFSQTKLHYINKGRLGSPSALNEAINASSGEYIAINDADDISKPCRLSYAVNFLKLNPEIVLLGTGYQIINKHPVNLSEIRGNILKDDHVKPRFYGPFQMYIANPFVHSTIVFPKNTWRKIGGYDEKLSMCVDYDFYLRAIKLGRAAFLPQETILFYKNVDSFFKKKTKREYIKTLIKIKMRARRNLQLPLWVIFYDIYNFYRIIRYY